MQKAPSTAAQGAEPGTAQPARTARKTRNAVAAEGEQDASDAAATARALSLAADAAICTQRVAC